MIYKNVELHNIEHLLEDENNQGLLMSRVPMKVRENLNPKAQMTAFDGPGCEIRFNIRSGSVVVTLLRLPATEILGKGICEIYYGSFQGPYFISPQIVGNKPEKIRIDKPAKIKLMEKIAKEKNMPFDPNLVRVILPYDWRCCLLGIEGDCSPPKENQIPQKKYLVYGSSITHGSTSVRPSGIYPRIIADKLGFDLINLGFAGSACLDRELADYITERKDWEFAILELGINVIELTVKEFREKVDYFINKLVENNQDRWFFCIDIFTCFRDYLNQVKIKEFRKIISDKVQSINSPKLVYVSGKDLLTSASSLTADLLHPSASGMEEIASKLYKKICKSIF